MNLSKSILAFSTLFLLIGILPAIAQEKGKKASFEAVSLSSKAKGTFISQLKALKDLGPSAKRAIQSIEPGSIKGFNIGMPPGRSSQVIHIIFAEFKSDIKMVDRSRLDAFKANAGLSDLLQKKGMNPNRGMAFQFNTRTLKIEPFSGPSGTGKQ